MMYILGFLPFVFTLVMWSIFGWDGFGILLTVSCLLLGILNAGILCGAWRDEARKFWG